MVYYLQGTEDREKLPYIIYDVFRFETIRYVFVSLEKLLMFILSFFLFYRQFILLK